MNLKYSSIQFFFIFVVFFLGVGALGVMISPNDAEYAVPGEMYIWVLIYLIFTLLSANYYVVFTRILRSDYPLLLVIFIPLISIFWSGDFGITLQRSVAYLGTCLIGLYLGVKYKPNILIGLLNSFLIFSIALSIVFCVVFPETGVMVAPHEGAWRGIFIHKNYLGRISALCAVFSIVLLLQETIFRKKVYRVISISICLLALVKSKSAGGGLLFVFMASSYFVSRFYMGSLSVGKNYIFKIVTFSVLLGFIYPVYQYIDVLLSLVDKDTKTVFGRYELWQYAMNSISEKPWIGYGYSVFWTGESSPAFLLRELKGWYAPHSHNGYLDSLLDLGFLGLTILVVFLFRFYNMVFSIHLRNVEKPYRSCVAIFLLWLVASNFFESAFYQRNDCIWMILISFYVSIHLRVKERVSE